MLPPPAVSKYHRRIHFKPTNPRRQLLDGLRKQSRLTNLGVVLLIGAFSISILLNLHYWISTPYHRPFLPLFSLDLSTVERPTQRERLTHLIIVPCHSIWTGTNSWSEEKDWVLESYQKGSGRVKAFYEHISRGVELARDDLESLLIFSGGQTKMTSSTTEAESYLRLGQTRGILPDQSPTIQPLGRATTENFALDSYQNLLFSIARFREYTGHFPVKITVVGYDFKRPRFEELHRSALRWPKNKFNYIGVDPEHADEDSSLKAIGGEQRNGYLPYILDRYGCHSTLLKKRRLRNPHARFHPYGVSVPELISLFEWCPGDSEGGEDTIFPGDLPWQRLTLRRESS